MCGTFQLFRLNVDMSFFLYSLYVSRETPGEMTDTYGARPCDTVFCVHAVLGVRHAAAGFGACLPCV